MSQRSRAGGVSIWWAEEVDIITMDMSLHFVDIAVTEEEGRWRFTGLYGWPNGSDKWRTWALLSSLSQQWDGPWLCGGDFNQVRSVEGVLRTRWIWKILKVAYGCQVYKTWGSMGTLLLGRIDGLEVTILKKGSIGL
ncbi:unnamed protein product [Linum trigynum]|uniref:Uncharacterized protein n=1 Tax=Linum trigynum TaxID=586398 RepID=A0AAV2D9T4_9ROSI